MRSGVASGPNPWDASTLEWATSSPPPTHNFDGLPVISNGTIHFENSSTNQSEVAAATTEMITHEGEETHTSYWPIIMALAAFVFLLGIVYSVLVVQISVAIGVIGLYAYSREKFVVRQERSESWPFQGVGNVKLGVWFFLASEVIFFSALIAAYIFVRINSVTWPAPGEIFSIQHGAINTFILLTSSLTAVLALVAAKQGSKRGLLGGLTITFILGLAFLINKASEWSELFEHGFDFASGLPASSYFITTGAHSVHIMVGLVIIVYLLIRGYGGMYTKGDSDSVEQFGLYWHFVDIVWVFLFPIFYLI